MVQRQCKTQVNNKAPDRPRIIVPTSAAGKVPRGTEALSRSSVSLRAPSSSVEEYVLSKSTEEGKK